MTVTVNRANGLHTRAAATIIDLVSRRVACPAGTQIYLHAKERVVPVQDLLAVVSLRVRKGDIVGVTADPGVPEQVVREVVEFLRQEQEEAPYTETVDRLIQEMALTSEAIFNNMSNGLVIVNRDERISFMNTAASLYLRVDAKVAVGCPVEEVIPGLYLREVLRTGRAKIGEKRSIGKRSIVANCTPIVIDGQTVGAMLVFQDISEIEKLASELEEVKELKQSLQLVLASAHDAICVTDEKGVIKYLNPAYERLYKIEAAEIVGKSVAELSPAGVRAKVLKSKQSLIGAVVAKKSGQKVVANVSPILVDQQIKGVVSITRELSEVQQLLEKLQLAEAKAEYLQEELSRQQGLDKAFGTIVGQSGVLMDALAMANKAAKTGSTVLVTGESGTGKELVAQAIHECSKRRAAPFVRINCAGIPPTLIESELFGHEKGAFTGALKMRKGKFELAQHGTVFLDEIGELPLEVQAKLLRVLQERELERVGSNGPIALDVRVIAATNRDLQQMVKNGAFREDLYYRINVIQIQLPPLRERMGDVPLLVEAFLHQLNGQLGKNIKACTPEVLDCLSSYAWPGNVRELKNILERAMNLCDGELITLRELPSYLRPASPVSKEPVIDDRIRPMAEYERLIIERALDQFGSFNAAAKALGLTHKTVAAKARKFGLASMVGNLEQGLRKNTRKLREPGKRSGEGSSNGSGDGSA